MQEKLVDFSNRGRFGGELQLLGLTRVSCLRNECRTYIPLLLDLLSNIMSSASNRINFFTGKSGLRVQSSVTTRGAKLAILTGVVAGDTGGAGREPYGVPCERNVLRKGRLTFSGGVITTGY